MDIDKIADKAKKMLKAEARDAASGPSPEKEKTKDEVKKVDETPKETPKANIEEVALKDEEILAKKDEDLDDSQKKRKADLVKLKTETAEKTEKSKVQKRFDELTAKIKTLEADRNSTKADRDSLKSELDDIKKQLSMTPQDKIKDKVKNEMVSRRNKYLDEDKGLPKEERREMTKDELDEWASEDYEAVQEWITKRTLRRHEEEQAFLVDEDQKVKAEEILDAQQKSAEKTYVAYPELDISARQSELVKEGKSKEEILNIIAKENQKYGLCMEIFKENPTKYMLSKDGPELIVKEMEKRLPKSSAKDDGDIEKLKKELADTKAEIERLKNLDTDVTSTHKPEPKQELTDLEKKQVELAKKVGLDSTRLKARIQLRKEKGYDD